MLILRILNALGIGLFCWLIFTLAVWALPSFVAFAAGVAAFHSGAGMIGALFIAAIVGGLTFAVGRLAFATARSRVLRAFIAAAFALPAAIAGYHVVQDISKLAVPSSLWCDVFAWIGAASIGGIAWSRVSTLAEPARPVGP
jgi:hypothetical protein